MGTILRRFCDGCGCEEPGNVIYTDPLKDMLGQGVGRADLCLVCLKLQASQIVSTKTKEMQAEILHIQERLAALEEAGEQVAALKAASEEDMVQILEKMEGSVWGL